MGHVVATEKEMIKAYIKGLPLDMMSMVRVSKASTLHEAIKEAQLLEDAYKRGREERSGEEKVGGKLHALQEAKDFQQQSSWDRP